MKNLTMTQLGQQLLNLEITKTLTEEKFEEIQLAAVVIYKNSELTMSEVYTYDQILLGCVDL